MKLSKDFISHVTETESLLVPSGGAKFSGIIKGNKTFGLIVELLKNDITEQGIIDSLRSEFDAPEGKIESDVRSALDELRNAGAIVD
ncbi:MAG: PqqD family protein [Synergistaceae bacterium]|nr:PqqD family protein [Synergistaceae bacterium]